MASNESRGARESSRVTRDASSRPFGGLGSLPNKAARGEARRAMASATVSNGQKRSLDDTSPSPRAPDAQRPRLDEAEPPCISDGAPARWSGELATYSSSDDRYSGVALLECVCPADPRAAAAFAALTPRLELKWSPKTSLPRTDCQAVLELTATAGAQSDQRKPFRRLERMGAFMDDKRKREKPVIGVVTLDEGAGRYLHVHEVVMAPSGRTCAVHASVRAAPVSNGAAAVLSRVAATALAAGVRVGDSPTVPITTPKTAPGTAADSQPPRAPAPVDRAVCPGEPARRPRASTPPTRAAVPGWSKRCSESPGPSRPESSRAPSRAVAARAPTTTRVVADIDAHIGEHRRASTRWDRGPEGASSNEPILPIADLGLDRPISAVLGPAERHQMPPPPPVSSAPAAASAPAPPRARARLEAAMAAGPSAPRGERIGLGGECIRKSPSWAERIGKRAVSPTPTNPANDGAAERGGAARLSSQQNAEVRQIPMG